MQKYLFLSLFGPINQKKTHFFGAYISRLIDSLLTQTIPDFFGFNFFENSSHYRKAEYCFNNSMCKNIIFQPNLQQLTQKNTF